jgi:hypothetical protein
VHVETIVGICLELHNMLEQRQLLPVEKQEDLIEVIFDWNDLGVWLSQQRAG